MLITWMISNSQHERVQASNFLQQIKQTLISLEVAYTTEYELFTEKCFGHTLLTMKKRKLLTFTASITDNFSKTTDKARTKALVME